METMRGYDKWTQSGATIPYGSVRVSSKEEDDIHAAFDGVMVLDRHIAPSIRSMVTPLRSF
jgi:hypothetical protein